MTWAGIVCMLSCFEIFAVVIVAEGTRRLFGPASISETVFIAFTLALFPLGIVLMILGAWRFRKVKKKAKVGLLQEGETKRNPGVSNSIVLFLLRFGAIIQWTDIKGNSIYVLLWTLLVRSYMESNYAARIHYGFLVSSIPLCSAYYFLGTGNDGCQQNRQKDKHPAGSSSRNP